MCFESGLLIGRSTPLLMEIQSLAGRIKQYPLHGPQAALCHAWGLWCWRPSQLWSKNRAGYTATEHRTSCSCRHSALFFFLSRCSSHIASLWLISKLWRNLILTVSRVLCCLLKREALEVQRKLLFHNSSLSGRHFCHHYYLYYLDFIYFLESQSYRQRDRFSIC